MRNLPMISFKILIEEFCDELKRKSIKYVESKEFKKSEYDHYTAIDLVEAINNEEHEEKRAALTCLLHYKIEHRFFPTQLQRR